MTITPQARGSYAAIRKVVQVGTLPPLLRREHPFGEAPVDIPRLRMIIAAMGTVISPRGNEGVFWCLRGELCTFTR